MTLSENSKIEFGSSRQQFGGEFFRFAENVCFAVAKRLVRRYLRFRFQALVFEHHEFDFAVGADAPHPRRRERRRL